jgi:hypothetical protein
MTNTWRDYRSFKITTNKTYEEARDRIARGLTEPVVTGHYFYVWRRCNPEQGFQGFCRMLDLPIVDYPTESEAVIKAQEAIDEILKYN